MSAAPLLWKCDPTSALGVEINFETVYGGTSTTNFVAEVDVTVGLCQIISGFIPGEVYELSFDCSGRSSTCGPPIQTMDVIIDGGALFESIIRDNTFFDLANERFCFTATQSTHELSFNSTTTPAESCGNIVDNVIINSYALNINEDQVICQGESVDIDVSAFGSSYLWQDNSTNGILTADQAGTYSVEIFGEFCPLVQEILVSVTDFNVDLGADITLCEGDNIMLDATEANASYTWQDASLAPTFNVSESGNYSVDVTVGNCVRSDEIVVDFNVFSVNLGSDTIICIGESLILDVDTSNATYMWQNNSTLPNFTITDAGVYNVDVTIGNCTMSDEIIVDLNDFQVNLGPDVSICQGDSYAIDPGIVNATYLWQNNSTDAIFIAPGAGDYNVEVMLGNCVSSDQITISNEFINLNLGNDIELCEGELLTLDATVPGGTYLWQDNSTNATFLVTEAGSYAVEVEVNGCSYSDAITVTYGTFNIDLGPDISICQGETIILDAAVAGATFLWSDNSSESTLEVTSSGTYSVISTLGSCVAEDVVNVIVNPVPNIDLGPDIVTCDDSPILLDVSWPLSDYLWQDSSTNPSYTVSGTGNYSVTVTSNGCTDTDEISIDYSGIAIDLGSDISACDGESIVLDASNTVGTYLWQNNSTDPNLTVTQNGNYSVTITSGPCVANDEINVNFGVLEVDLGEDVFMCEGETVILDATVNSGNYIWQDNSVSETFTVSQSGIYSVNIISGSCTDSDSIEITVNPLPLVDLGPDQSYCIDTILQLDVVLTNATYLWQDNSTAQMLSVNQSGLYGVSVTQNGCVSNDEVQINLGSLVVELGPDVGVCESETILLNSGISGADYLWQDNSIGQTYSVSEAGTYSVEVILNGCSANDEIIVTSNAFEVDLGNDISLCEGESIVLDCEINDATYLWQDLSDEQSIVITEEGSYTITVYQNNCTSTDQVYVSIGDPQIDLGNDTTLCAGQSLILNAYLEGATYEWQDNSLDSILLVNVNGTYSVSVNLGNCSTDGSINVEFIESPIIDLGPDQNICEGSTLELNAVWPDASYLWQDNSTLPFFEVSTSGTYNVSVSVGTCSTNDTIIINTDLPEIFLGNDTSLCEGISLNLFANVPNASFSWQDNSNSNIFTVSSEGLYWVTVNVNGCVNSDSIYVEYNPIPSASISGGMVHCPDEMIDLEVIAVGTPPFLIGFTKDGIPLNSVETIQNFYSLSTNESGVYQVSSISDALCYNGPQNSTSITDYPPLVVNISYDESICEGESTYVTATYAGGQNGDYSSYWIDQNGQIYFDNPLLFTGLESTTLNLVGTDLCQSEVYEDITIEVQQYPEPVIFSETDSICQETEMILTSNYINEDINCTWIINDLEIYGCGPITHNFTTPGYQNITLLSESSAGCVGVISSDTLLFVLSNPIADFAYEGETGKMFDPGIQFVNHSDGATDFFWDFGDGNTSNIEEPFNYYPYGESGEYQVCLIASNELSCEDVHCDNIEILPELIIHIPNSFTPDEDGVNDLFRPVLNDVNLAEYALNIYDRGGQIIFESHDQNEFWNGSNETHNEYYIQDGVYTYHLSLREEGKSETKEYRGMITLIR